MNELLTASTDTTVATAQLPYLGVEYIAVAWRPTSVVHLSATHRQDDLLIPAWDTLCGKRTQRMAKAHAAGRAVTCRDCLRGLDDRRATDAAEAQGAQARELAALHAADRQRDAAVEAFGEAAVERAEDARARAQRNPSVTPSTVIGLRPVTDQVGADAVVHLAPNYLGDALCGVPARYNYTRGLTPRTVDCGICAHVAHAGLAWRQFAVEAGDERDYQLPDAARFAPRGAVDAPVVDTTQVDYDATVVADCGHPYGHGCTDAACAAPADDDAPADHSVPIAGARSIVAQVVEAVDARPQHLRQGELQRALNTARSQQTPEAYTYVDVTIDRAPAPLRDTLRPLFDDARRLGTSASYDTCDAVVGMYYAAEAWRAGRGAYARPEGCPCAACLPEPYDVVERDGRFWLRDLGRVTPFWYDSRQAAVAEAVRRNAEAAPQG